MRLLGPATSIGEAISGYAGVARPDIPGGISTPPTAPATADATAPVPVDVGVAGRPVTLRLVGDIPFESWNRFGTRLLSKLKGSGSVSLTLTASVELDGAKAAALKRELTVALQELGLDDRIRIE